MRNSPWHKTTEEILALLLDRSIGRSAPVAWTVIRRLQASLEAGK